MGIMKSILSNTVGFISQEIMPLRQELIKAGFMSPASASDYQPKALLSDPFAYNASVYGYKEKYTAVDFSKARQISYSDPIISAIIQTRTNQFAAFANPQENRWKMGFRITNRDKKKAISGKGKKKAQELERFVVACGFPESTQDTPETKKRDNFEQFLRKYIRDSLTFDACTAEIVPRRNGLPASFRAIDASTIRLLPDEFDQKLRDGGPSHQQILITPIWEQAKRHVKDAKNPRYVQLMNGCPVAEFEEWEMAYGVRNPRTDILMNGYGFSEIEMLLPVITAHINADTYNRRFFSQGSSQKGILSFEGNVPPDQLDAFRRQWHQQCVGVANSWRTPIVATGKDNKLNWISLHSTNKEMEWGKYIEYLVKSICAVYQIDPIEIGFDISKNSSGQGGGSSIGGQGQQVERQKLSKDRGLDPLLRFVSYQINEYIVWRIDPDLEFEFVGLNVNSEKEQLDMDKTQVETFKTLNELRAEYDLPAIKTPDQLKDVGDFVMSQQFIQAVGSAQSAAQLDQGQGGPDQGQGGPDQGQGGPDQGQGGPDAEPNYDQMSDEELQAELDKLKGGGKPEDKPMKKSLRAEFII